jgi:hypothetical protein
MGFDRHLGVAKLSIDASDSLGKSLDSQFMNSPRAVFVFFAYHLALDITPADAGGSFDDEV